MGQSHPFRGFRLSQAKGLDFGFVGVRQTQIGKDVAGTGFNFDAIDDTLSLSKIDHLLALCTAGGLDSSGTRA